MGSSGHGRETRSRDDKMSNGYQTRMSHLKKNNHFTYGSAGELKTMSIFTTRHMK